jgi:hypothetical protein
MCRKSRVSQPFTNRLYTEEGAKIVETYHKSYIKNFYHFYETVVFILTVLL